MAISYPYSVVSAPGYYVEPKTIFIRGRPYYRQEIEGIVFSRHQTMDAAIKAAQTRHPYLSVVVADNSAGPHKGNRFPASNMPAILWQDGVAPARRHSNPTGGYWDWDSMTPEVKRERLWGYMMDRLGSETATDQILRNMGDDELPGGFYFDMKDDIYHDSGWARIHRFMQEEIDA